MKGERNLTKWERFRLLRQPLRCAIGASLAEEHHVIVLQKLVQEHPNSLSGKTQTIVIGEHTKDCGGRQ